MSSKESTAFVNSQVSQSKAGTTTTFAFSPDELKFTLANKSSSTTFKTSYTAMSRDQGFLVERNDWLRNVGFLWIALGLASIAISYAQAQKLVPSIWLFLGIGCAGWAWLRTVRYVTVPAESGTLLVIEDSQKAALLDELDARRTDQLLRWHDFMDANEDPERQRNRFNWLREEGALSEAELGERLGRLDHLVAPVQVAVETVLPGDRTSGTSLN